MLGSVAKRTYDAVALFAVLNMVALVAVTTYAFASGGVNGEKLEHMVGVLRGDEPQPAPTEQEEGPDAVEDRKASSADAVAKSQVDLEIMRREADRIKEELRQRLALNNSILLRATNEREAFEKERMAEENRRKARRREREEQGFNKQVEILEAMKPKIAVVHLLSMGDLDEAARVLLAMDTRQAKKIVEAAKGGEQMAQMINVLQKIREVAPDRSTDFDDKRAEN
jgi:hypothetical protein